MRNTNGFKEVALKDKAISSIDAKICRLIVVYIQHGMLLVFVAALAPIIQPLVVILASLANTPLTELAAVVLSADLSSFDHGLRRIPCASIAQKSMGT